MGNKILNNIDTITKELIVDSLNNSAELFKEFKMQTPFNTTHNCYPSARWDSINETLSDSLRDLNFPFAVAKKGFWALLLFCDSKKEIIFSAMRRDRFEYICDNPEKNAPQYFDALVSLNNGLEAKVSQMRLDDCYEATDKYNQLDSLCKLLPAPSNDKFTHAVVVFDISYDEITSIKLYIVNNRFEIVEEEDIMDSVIRSRIPLVVPDKSPDIQNNDTEKRKGLVSLKKNVQKSEA
ncbi:MAG: hypothetical protein IJE14_00280 [Clostridia bacterium]|nr:hypothetical protein [Clostridia bacterium]